MQIIQQLRHGTRTSHESLEDGYGILDRLACVSGRRAVIAGLFSVYAPAEKSLTPFLEPIPGLRFTARCKSPRLAADLLDLGLTHTQLGTLPLEPIAAFDGAARALGFAYVLEGATLGGAVIRKRLIASGQSLVGLSFYNCYGSAVGQHWMEFCSILEDACSGRAEETIEGALEGFRAVGRALQRSLSALSTPEPPR